MGICDSYIKWTFPIPDALPQGQTTMGIGPLAVGLVLAAMAVTLLALGWAVSKVTLILDAVLDVVDPTQGFFWGLVALGIGAVVLVGNLGGRRSQT